MTDAPKDKTAKPSTGETIIEQAEGLFEQAREAVADALEATVEAVKEHPVATAAIVGGAAAAVVGAVYGAGKLRADDDKTATKAPARK